MNCKRATISLIVSFAWFPMNAQQSDKYAIGNLLYLHLDKSIYAPEETIWFKAYLLGDTTQQAKVLYVRLVDDEKNEVFGVQFPIYDIRAHGSIELSESSNIDNIGLIERPFRLEGSYILYAYTDRMIALNDTNVFVQPIQISRLTSRRLEATASVSDTSMLHSGSQVQIKVQVKESGNPIGAIKGEYQLLVGDKELKYSRLNTNVFGEAFVNFTYPELDDRESLKVKLIFTYGNDQVELKLNLAHHGNPLTITCLPEGGKPVPGGQVAIEVLDILGNPVETRLQVMEGMNVVASLVTDSFGMCNVLLPEIGGVQYAIKTVDGRGKTILDVPSAAGLQGLSLKLQHDSIGKIAVITNHGPDSTALLVLRSHSEILWSAQQNIQPGDSIGVIVPATRWPKDVLSLAVLDLGGTLHAERLFLNKDEDDYDVSISTEKQEYGNKKRVVVILRAMDRDGKPVIANFSVSATWKSLNDRLRFRSILRQWHSRGFAQPVRNRLICASSSMMSDDMLLGSSWYKNDFKGIPSYEPEERVSVYGVTGITRFRTDKLTLRSFRGFRADGNNVIRNVETMSVNVDRKTRKFFVADSLLLSYRGQEWEFVPALPDGDILRAKNYLIDWLNPDAEFDSIVTKGRQLTMPDFFTDFSSTITPKIKEFNFNGMNLIDEVVIGGTEMFLPLTLRKSRCEQYEDIIRSAYNKIRNVTMEESLLTKGKSYTWNYTPYGEPKAIIYLGCGRYRDINYIRNITLPEDFPLPDYDARPATELDMRSTVYWNPNIYTDADGMATFSFFTSDVTGEFEIVAQGLVESTLRPLMGSGSFKVVNR